MKTIKTKKELEALMKKLPKDFSQHCVREIMLLSFYLFGKAHMIAIPEKFKSRFSSMFFHHSGGMTTVFRSQEDYDNFSKAIGEKAKKDPLFAKKLSDTLIGLTDWFNDFLPKNRGFKKEDFIRKYIDFFAYHQAVYWGGDHLCRTDPEGAKDVIALLDNAYKYNEMVVPKIEKYIKKIGIAHLLPSEIGRKEDAAKDRGMLFIGKGEYLLPQEISKQLYDYMRAKRKSGRKIKGISAYPGRCKGRVRLILDPNKLGTVKKGDILVTSMTRPQFNPQIRVAKAIITDEGGMLSHAAIISREFKIPCIVGTRNATSILKEGDMIEVDADKGIVNLLHRGLK